MTEQKVSFDNQGGGLLHVFYGHNSKHIGYIRLKGNIALGIPTKHHSAVAVQFKKEYPRRNLQF